MYTTAAYTYYYLSHIFLSERLCGLILSKYLLLDSPSGKDDLRVAVNCVIMPQVYKALFRLYTNYVSYLYQASLLLLLLIFALLLEHGKGGAVQTQNQCTKKHCPSGPSLKGEHVLSSLSMLSLL